MLGNWDKEKEIANDVMNAVGAEFFGRIKAHDIYYTAPVPGICFRFKKKNGYNKCRITQLDGSNFRMEFYRVKRRWFGRVPTHISGPQVKNVEAGNIINVFNKITGHGTN